MSSSDTGPMLLIRILVFTIVGVPNNERCTIVYLFLIFFCTAKFTKTCDKKYIVSLYLLELLYKIV